MSQNKNIFVTNKKIYLSKNKIYFIFKQRPNKKYIFLFVKGMGDGDFRLKKFMSNRYSKTK